LLKIILKTLAISFALKGHDQLDNGGAIVSHNNTTSPERKGLHPFLFDDALSGLLHTQSSM